MSNVSVTDTQYNITVTETNNSVTVSSGDAITVLVDTFTISTAVVNSGSGANVGKEITGDTLTLRSITAGDNIIVTENTDDISIAVPSTINANLTGDTLGTHFGQVQGNVTGNVTGNVVGNINSDVSSINTITDVFSITNSSGLTIDTQDVIIQPDNGSVYITSDDFTTYVEVALDYPNIGTQEAVIKGGTNTNPIIYANQVIQTGGRGASFDGSVYMADTLTVNGLITGQVSDISNHTTTDLTEGDNLYYTQARFDSAFDAKDTDDLTEGSNLYYTQARFDTAFSNKTTTDLTEGTNLYWTQTRFDDAVANITTDDVSEGSNLYYTDARVQTKLGDVSGHIIPDTDNTYDLGSTDKKWRSLYLSGGSLYIEGQKVVGSTDGTINITTDNGENIDIYAGGTGSAGDVIINSASGITRLDGTDIKLGPVGGTGTTTVRGTLDANDLHIGDLELEPTLINNTATNQNLEIRTAGTGYLHANVADFYVGTISPVDAVKIDEGSISRLGGGTLTITGDLTGDVTGTVSDISNHTTTNLTEGTNLYYTDARVQSVIDTNTAGFITDYTVTEADVTQHQAALSITESQISDLTHYTDADARTAVSLNSSNLNELSYDNTTGVFTYTSPSTVAATGQVVIDVRNKSGVAISRGDAVYLAGHSGNKILVALADANAVGEHPAIGLANSAMANNSDGTVLIQGEMDSIDTSAFSVNDVLYVSETAGELTATRPSSESTAVQNMGKVARSHTNNGIIVVTGAGRENDVPNLASGHVFIGNGSGYEKRALDTDDVSEGANLYYTDGRARASISASGSLSYNSSTGEISYTQPTNVSTFTNDAGYLTSYTETDPIYTASSWYSTTNNSANWDTAYSWGDHSNAGYVNSSGAISAVEGEATLDLTGDVTISQDLDVSGLVKVNDGFTLGSFNPYAGFGGTAMSTSVMGVGQESGWAGMTIRSRGEHDWGLSGFGIPPEAPRALLALQGGRLDGSNDDYLNSGDKFAEMMFNPYSGYRTGTEWLTPSATVEASATENHSSSGMGTKLRLWTTKDGDFAGATDASHNKSWIDIQGETITTSGTLTIDDDAKITGNLELNGNLNNNGSTIDVTDEIKVTGSVSSKNTVIGDATASGGLYNTHGFKVEAGDTAWASVILDEYVGGNDKPAPAFSNPTIVGQVTGGTVGNETAVPSGKRLFTMAGQGTYDNGGSIEFPPTASFRMFAETTENQTSTGRGTKFQIETTDNGTTNKNTVLFQGNTVNINSGGGDGVIRGGNNLKLGSPLDTTNQSIFNSGGDVTINDNLKVNDDLTVDGTTNLNGNVNLGNANTDTITATGKLNTSNGLGLTVLNTATANYLSGVLGIVSAGDVAYISDGDGGDPCIGVYNGSSWKRIALGSDISST